MSRISIRKLVEFARKDFAAVSSLANSSKAGCVAARKAIKRAAAHGLDGKPYTIVRRGGNIVLAGWCGGGIGPLHVVSVGGAK